METLEGMAQTETLRGKGDVVLVKISRQVSNAGSGEYKCNNRHARVREQREFRRTSISVVEQTNAGDPAIGVQSHHDTFESLALYTKN